MAKVSIIIPVYNQEKYIGEAIHSVLNQTYKDWECIIIDDGSIDKSWNVITKKVGFDSRFIITTKRNEGVCITRNLAISMASGEYVLFLDGDDKISTNFLEISVGIMEQKRNVKIVTPKVYFFGRYRGEYTLPPYKMEILLSRNIFIITSLCRMSDVVRVGGFNSLMVNGLEDWDFWISILANGGEVIHLNSIIFYYRILKKSRNRTLTDTDLVELRKIIWNNHKKMYADYFLDPKESMEYKMIYDSAEYKVGKIVLSIWRFFQKNNI